MRLRPSFPSMEEVSAKQTQGVIAQTSQKIVLVLYSA